MPFGHLSQTKGGPTLVILLNKRDGPIGPEPRYYTHNQSLLLSQTNGDPSSLAHITVRHHLTVLNEAQSLVQVIS
jgi:hypothetical protein